MKYFDYPEHVSWQRHYVEGFYGGFYLAFTKQFLDENLPPHLDFRAETVDLLQVGLVLQNTIDVSFSDEIHPVYELLEQAVLDEDYNAHDVWTLQNYFYSEHYCPCHRLHGARRHGYRPNELDYEPDCPKDICGSILFDVRKICCKNHPDLILYSETMSYVQLEERLIPMECE